MKSQKVQGDRACSEEEEKKKQEKLFLKEETIIDYVGYKNS